MRDYIIEIEVATENGRKRKRFKCHAMSVTDAVAIAECELGFIKILNFIKI